MKIMRNKEIRRTAAVFFAVGAAGSGVCFLLDRRGGAVAAAVFLLLLLIYLWDVSLRYRRMASLAARLDEILHGEQDMSLSEYREGEFSLLQNEMSKLLGRLREQTDLLKKEKVMLADSMADISHQLRTPLTTMNLIMETLQEGGLSQELVREHLLEMRRLSGRTQWLISALLKMARLDAGTIVFRKEDVTLSQVAERALEPFTIPMELKNQRLRMNVEGSFVGDLSWTAEAIGNLIKNCMEHMQEGTLFITGEENALYTQLQIRDSGDGIAQGDLPRLFERFYKGANSGDQNVGIGLALSRMIITGQNGTIKAENSPQGGALFTVRFYKGNV